MHSKVVCNEEWKFVETNKQNENGKIKGMANLRTVMVMQEENGGWNHLARIEEERCGQIKHTEIILLELVKIKLQGT